MCSAPLHCCSAIKHPIREREVSAVYLSVYNLQVLPQAASQQRQRALFPLSGSHTGHSSGGLYYTNLHGCVQHSKMSLMSFSTAALSLTY